MSNVIELPTNEAEAQAIIRANFPDYSSVVVAMSTLAERLEELQDEGAIEAENEWACQATLYNLDGILMLNGIDRLNIMGDDVDGELIEEEDAPDIGGE